MGLLDALFAGNQGGGGLLSYLQSPVYPSPLNQPQDAPQPQYDPMGNYTGPGLQPTTSPFPDLPQSNYAQFAPKPDSPLYSPFAQGAAPVSGMAPSQPIPTPQPPAVQPPVTQVQDANVGGYQMPRFGSVADYTPQAMSTDISAQSRQPPQAQAQQQPLPPALNNSGGLGAGLRGIVNNLHTGPLGALAGGIGNSLGLQGPEQQNLKAQYEALVPLVGQQKAMLAVLNPEAGKTILAQALEKKQYGFTKLDSDTIVRTDPLTGKAEIAYGGGEDSKTITGPDGKPITIPPGVDRKTFVNEVSRANAKAAAGEKTEVQAKSEIFANKMEQSNKSITDGVGTSLTGKIASGLPLGNYVQSPDYQKYKQASSNFITALLRQESGAAISKSEFERYDKEYMPQPGDSSEVLAQKTEARRIAIEGMKKGAGPGYKSPTAAALPSGWSVQVR